MKKRIISVTIMVLVLVLALFVLSACSPTETLLDTEILVNGDFESFNDDDKTFDNWNAKGSSDKTKYFMRPIKGNESSSNNENFHEGLGEQYLEFDNQSSGNMTLSQTVKIDRNQIYKFTVDMRLVGDVKKGSNDTFRGAYVSFLENTEWFFVEEKKADGSNWSTKTFYIKPSNTDYLTVTLNLGAEGESAEGKVFFDNASLMRVDASSVPSDFTVHNVRASTIARYENSTSGILFIVFLTLLSVSLSCGAYVAIRRIYASPKAFLNFGETSQVSSKVTGKKKQIVNKVVSSSDIYKNPLFIALMLVLGTLFTRLIIILTTVGFGQEMSFFAELANLLGQNGAIADAYTKPSLQPYSPGTLYILSILGFMGEGLGRGDLSILIRMVNVLGDIAVVLMIYFYGKKYVGNKLSTIYAGLYSCLPIVFIMSGMNNTFEGLLVAFLLGTLILLIEKQYAPMFIVYVLAIVLDIRALAIAPLIVTYLGYMWYRDADSLKKVTKLRVLLPIGLIVSVLGVYALTVPIASEQIGQGDVFANFRLFANIMISNNIFSVDAINLYAMVGMNMKMVNTTVSVLNIIFILVLQVFAVSLYFKNKNKMEILLIASFILATIAVFTLKVSFTYLFLAFAIGLVYTMISGDKRLYAVMAMYGALMFVVLGQIINISDFLGGSFSSNLIHFDSTSPEYIFFCVVGVLTTLYYAYVTYSITSNSKIVDIKPMKEKVLVAAKNCMNNVSSKFSRSKK